MTNRTRLLQETIQARQRAAALVEALVQASTASEPVPKRDLYKRVTGSSSLDNAIAEARRAVEAYDRLIGEIEKEAEKGDPQPEVVVRPDALRASGSASGFVSGAIGCLVPRTATA